MTSATGQTTMKLDQVMAEWQNASLEIEELLRQSKQIETAVPAPEETPASAITPPGTSCEQDPVSEPRLTLSSPSERRTPELITRVLRECRIESIPQNSLVEITTGELHTQQRQMMSTEVETHRKQQAAAAAAAERAAAERVAAERAAAAAERAAAERAAAAAERAAVERSRVAADRAVAERAAAERAAEAKWRQQSASQALYESQVAIGGDEESSTGIEQDPMGKWLASSLQELNSRFGGGKPVSCEAQAPPALTTGCTGTSCRLGGNGAPVESEECFLCPSLEETNAWVQWILQAKQLLDRVELTDSRAQQKAARLAKNLVLAAPPTK